MKKNTTTGFDVFIAFERKALGYVGTTVVIPGGTSSNIRYIIRRFTDRASMEIWDNSPDVQKLLNEANRYSTRHYETATGLETWFVLPDLKTVVPPRWKMAILVFIAAYTTTLLSRSFLNPVFSEWPLATPIPGGAHISIIVCFKVALNICLIDFGLVTLY